MEKIRKMLERFRTGKALDAGGDDVCQCGAHSLEADVVSRSEGDGFNHNREACRIDDHVKVGHQIVGDWRTSFFEDTLAELVHHVDETVDHVRAWKNKEREIEVERLKSYIRSQDLKIGDLTVAVSEQKEEVERLRKEVVSLEEERDILKAQRDARDGFMRAPVKCYCGKHYVDWYQCILSVDSDGVSKLHQRNSCTISPFGPSEPER